MFLNTVKPRCLGPSHPDKSLGWGQSESARVESRDWQLAAPQGLAFFLFIYLCAGSSLLLTLSLAAESEGCFLVVVCRLLAVVASLVKHEL